jgi:transposase
MMNQPPASELRIDIEDVRRKLEQLAAEGRIPALISLVIELLVSLRDTNTGLSVRLANALRELYGRKSQKITSDQLALMFATLGEQEPPGPEGEAAAPQPGNEPVPQPPEPPKPPRGGGGRRPLPKDLPRQERIIAVPEAERTCEQCGAETQCIGHRESEILEFVPAQFRVIVEMREKLACPACPEEGVVTAASEKTMDRGRPGPGLLAQIVVDKYHDATPIYRQAQQYARIGVALSPSTLGDWGAFGIDVLTPVAERIFERLVGSDYLHLDDTNLRVLDPAHPNGIKRGHIWTFVAQFPDDVKLVAFRYAPDWSSKRPAALLAGFCGYMQGDGYAGYDAMKDEDGARLLPDERRLACGMHIRAKFEKAAKLGDTRAVVALSYLKAIYRIEAACKAEGLCHDERQRRRDEQSMQHVDELYRWIHELHPRLVPKTPLYEATRYALGQEAAWRICFTQGRFEIDNGEAERSLRRIAIGRKNFLFAGSDKGAERLAVAYTVLGSCQLNGVDPLAWATDVIGKLQAGWPLSQLDELLPDAYARNAKASA